MTGGAVTDIPISVKPTREANPEVLRNELVRAVNDLRIIARLDRQHRKLLLAIADLAVPDGIDDLGGTAGGVYSAAELQSVMDKLDEISANQRAILALLTALVALPDAHIEPYRETPAS